MKVAQLLEKRRAGWRELEAMCRELEKGSARRLGAAGVLRFASAYRSACADLALADAYQLPPHTVQYLHELVGRAHNQLYRSQMFRWRAWGEELFVHVPRRLVADRALWLAFAIFWGIFLASGALGFASRKYCEQVVGGEALASLENSFAKPVRRNTADVGGAASGFYVMHNAGIGLRCFAGGLILGIGGLFITVSNAVQLGALFGYMFTLESRGNFLEFVTGHGPFELTAIVFSSAAGMRLGFSLIATGGLSRGASLRKAVVEATPTMAAAVILFCLAAVIEGFLSPSPAPYAVKAGVAILSIAILLFYVFGLGLMGECRVRIDQAQIAIRQRWWLDNLDLALHVIRAHGAAVLVCGLLGALPMMAINYGIVNYFYGSQLAEDAQFDAFVLAVLLVMIEAPLATAPLTFYLGQALFLEKPSPGQIARQFVDCLGQLILFQVLVRGALILPVVTWFIPYALWPYLNEVILLERNPLVGRQGQLSTMKRSSLLHRGNSGDYVVRGVAAGFLALGLTLALWVTQSMALHWLLGFQEGWTAQVISLQCVLWIVASYFTVARFLAYLDQRIRVEGWEVELFLRAQREWLTRHAP